MVPTAVAKLSSLLVADAYDVKVGVVGDNINTSEGANVISIVISVHSYRFSIPIGQTVS